MYVQLSHVLNKTGHRAHPGQRLCNNRMENPGLSKNKGHKEQ